jgi:cytochrome c oxidase accessory protein FixG
MKTEDVYQFDEEFRNSIATVDEKGKRIWLFPKKPSGYYHRLRLWVSWILLTLLFAGPFLKIDGQPFLLLNIFERRFVVFGQAFWPQDFFILALTLITFFVFVILFTVVFGRIWCGWMCPQTLFMEMVFRKIEYCIEGDAPAQRRLKDAPLSASKIFKKTTKHILFILISLIIAHTVMAYLIGIEKTWDIIQHNPSENIAGFIGLMVFTTLFYAVYARFREQACIAVCPYGRLQGVLLSKDSIVVAYDWLRGEPRGRISKQQTTTKGDCVDCKLCVHVCPTGIDIRNGTQLECINCTACMDACDDVMQKIGKPQGLIRYDSHYGIQNQTKKIFNFRVFAYCIVLAALVGVLVFVLATRSSVEATVLKVPGTLYQRTDDGYISNLYNIEFINKTFSDISLHAKVLSPEGAVLERVDQNTIEVPAEGFIKGVFFIKIPEDKLPSARTLMKVGIYQNDKLIETLSIKFIGPVSKSTDMKGRLEDQRNQTK